MAVLQPGLLLDGPDLVRTGISPKYVPGWGMAEALREVFQEYVDVRRQYGCGGSIRFGKAGVVVEDEGPGLPREALALGVSGKREDSRLIGQFGEGLKLAALVAAREGRRMEIETAGFTVVPGIVEDPALSCEVLAYAVRENCRANGTRITVEATPGEYLSARRCFLELSEEKPEVLWRNGDGRPVIFRPSGRVYVNGCLAQERGDLLFSYDLSGDAKGAQNRDRTVLDEDRLEDAVRDVLEDCRCGRVIRELFRSLLEDRAVFEHRLLLRPQGDRRLWKRAMHDVLGPRVALEDGTPADHEVKETYGYRVLSSLPWTWRELLSELGVCRSSRVLAEMRQRSGRRAELDPRERTVLEWACGVVSGRVGKVGKVEVVEALLSGNDVPVNGLWNGKEIRLCRSVLRDPAEALGTLVHEVLHKESGASDCTRAFERAWEHLAVKLLLEAEGRMPDFG